MDRLTYMVTDCPETEPPKPEIMNSFTWRFLNKSGCLSLRCFAKLEVFPPLAWIVRWHRLHTGLFKSLINPCWSASNAKYSQTWLRDPRFSTSCRGSNALARKDVATVVAIVHVLFFFALFYRGVEVCWREEVPVLFILAGVTMPNRSLFSL